MGYNTAETEWPSSTIVSEESKALLDHYFNLLDTNEATAGDTIAKLFTQDGSMITSAGIIQGSESTFCPSKTPPNLASGQHVDSFCRTSSLSPSRLGCDQDESAQAHSCLCIRS